MGMIDNRSDLTEATPDVEPEAQAEPSTAPVQEEETKTPDPSVEETTSPTTEPETQEKSTLKDASLKKNEDSSKQTRSAKRIQEILREKKELEEKLAQFTAKAPEPEVDPFAPNENGEIEMTKDQLQKYIENQVTTALSKEREVLTEQQRISQWDTDIEALMKENPVLNPDSPEFNSEINEHLVDLIRTTNTDDAGNPTVKKLPSEIWLKLSALLDLSKAEGTKLKNESLQAMEDSAAVRASNNDASTARKKFTSEEVLKIRKESPRKYTEMVQRGEI